MLFLLNLIFLIVIATVVVFITYFIINRKMKNKPPVSLMILGIEVTLVGGIFVNTPNSSIVNYLMVLIGLAITIAGFAKDNT